MTRARARHRGDQASVDPRGGRLDAVAAFGPVGADSDERETVLACFDRANGLRTNPDDVPLTELVHLVVEPDPARATDHDIRLFLFAMAMCHRGAEAGRVAQVADPAVLGVDGLACQASLQCRARARRRNPRSPSDS